MVADPYAVVAPYSICESDDSSVVHVTVASVEEAMDWILEIVGGITSVAGDGDGLGLVPASVGVVTESTDCAETFPAAS